MNLTQARALKTALANFKARTWEPSVYLSINELLEPGTLYLNRITVDFLDTSPQIWRTSMQLFSL